MPSVTNYSPADDSKNVLSTANLVLTFDEPIKAGTGTIQVWALDYIYGGPIPGMPGGMTTPYYHLIEEISANDTSKVTISSDGTTVTINPTATLNPYSIGYGFSPTKYYVKVNNTAFTNLKEESYIGISDDATWNFYTTNAPPPDTTPPTATFSPADESTDIAVDSNLVLTFNEAIKAGAGTIVIHRADGSGVETIDVTDTNKVTIDADNKTVTINPTTDLPAGQSYYVTIEKGAFEDTIGNDYAGIAFDNPTTWSFTTKAPAPPTDTTPPTATLSPTDEGTDVGVGSNLVLTFSEAIQKGTGNIEIHKVSDNSLVESIDVANSDEVTIGQDGKTVTVNPKDDLAANTDYYVTVTPGAFKDTIGNNYAGLAGYQNNDPVTYDWNFKTAAAGDLLAPTLSSHTPADDATDVAVDSNFVLTFSEAVKAGKGYLVLKSSVDGSTIGTIAASDTTQVTIEGATVTVNPADNLAAGKGYFVTIDPGAFQDIAGNDYAGIASDAPTIWNFTTKAADVPDTTPPTVTLFSPTDDSTGVAPDSNLVITFNETVMLAPPPNLETLQALATGGSIEIHKDSDDSLVETIEAADTTKVTIDGNKVIINPTTVLDSNTKYYVTIADHTFVDQSSNDFAGITDKTVWDFTTKATDVPPGDTTPPQVVSFSPSDDSTGVDPSSNLVITFNEAVKAAPDGRIVIYENYQGGLSQPIEIDANDTSQVTINGNTVTINPKADLAAGKIYTIGAFGGKDSRASAFTDLAGNSADITPKPTSWNFTTKAADQPVNHAPMLAKPIADQMGTASKLFSFTLPTQTFTDSDEGDKLTLKATLENGSPLPAWLSFDAAKGTFSGTPTANNVGTIALKVTATDTAQASTSDVFVLKVSGSPAPVPAPVPAPTPTPIEPDGKTGDPLTEIKFGGRAGKTINLKQPTGKDVHGSPFQDVIYGSKGDDRIFPGLRKDGYGDDRVYGGAGNDLIDGGKNNDYLDGGAGNDKVLGGSGRDQILGSDGNDRLAGGDGSDLLTGGNGNDTLTGGTGADMFIYTSTRQGTDTITDFNAAQDVIDLRAIFKQSAYAGDSSYKQFKQFVKLESLGSNKTAVKIDADGKGTSFNTLAVLQTTGSLTSNNFVIS